MINCSLLNSLPKTMFYRRLKGFFYAPASSKSLVDRRFREAKPLAPLHDNHRFSFESYSSCFPGVADLGFLCRPPNIIRFIVSIVVYSIERMLWRGRSAYIFKKCRKTFSPTVAHFDSASAVVAKKFGSCVMASRFYMTPGSVLLSQSSRRFAMLVVKLAYNLPPVTPAAFRVAIHQIHSAIIFDIAAIALAKYAEGPFSAIVKPDKYPRNYRQFSVAFVGGPIFGWSANHRTILS